MQIQVGKRIGPHNAAALSHRHSRCRSDVGRRTLCCAEPEGSRARSKRLGKDKFDWIHRRSEEGDIYFLANGSDSTWDPEVTFRVAGKTPELWDPLTGHIRVLPEFQEKGGRTVVPMRYEARQSFFVVFKRPWADRTPGPTG